MSSEQTMKTKVFMLEAIELLREKEALLRKARESIEYVMPILFREEPDAPAVAPTAAEVVKAIAAMPEGSIPAMIKTVSELPLPREAVIPEIPEIPAIKPVEPLRAHETAPREKRPYHRRQPEPPVNIPKLADRIMKETFGDEPPNDPKCTRCVHTESQHTGPNGKCVACWCYGFVGRAQFAKSK